MGTQVDVKKLEKYMWENHGVTRENIDEKLEEKRNYINKILTECQEYFERKEVS